MVADGFERKFFFLLDNMGLAPGLAFLSLHIPHLVGPPIFVYLASYLAKAVWGFACPAWLLAIAYVASWPLALTASVQYNDWKIEREAAAYGAELPPCIPSQRLGGWDLIKTISETLEKRILGAFPSRCFCKTRTDPCTPSAQVTLIGTGSISMVPRTTSVSSLKTGYAELFQFCLRLVL